MTKRIEFSEDAKTKLNGKNFNSILSEVKDKATSNIKRGTLKNGLFYEIMKRSIMIF
jgi:hypothetical protein